MARLSQVEFSTLAGVTKQAIGKAVACKRLLLIDGKIDTENPLSVRYLEEQKDKAAASSHILPSQGHRPSTKSTTSKPPASEPKINRGPPRGSSEAKKPKRGDTVSSPPSKPDDSDPEGLGAQILGLDTKKKQADIALKRAQTRRHDLYLSERKKELILRDLVRQDYAAYDAALKVNVRDMPARISAILTAIAISEGAPGVQRYLERELSTALDRCQKAADERNLT